jgi:uncharacterized membrane protein YgaE (UPF0421/DUF939 family)
VNFLRGSVFFGWVLISICVVLLIAYPSRPGWGFWADRVLVGVAVGLVVGVVIRFVIPQKQRAARTQRLVATGLGRRFGR